MPLPDKLYLEETAHENIKSIVLAELVNTHIDRRLKVDTASGVYEASLLREGASINRQSIVQTGRRTPCAS